MRIKFQKLFKPMLVVISVIATVILIFFANLRFGFINEDFLSQYVDILVPDYPEKSMLHELGFFTGTAEYEAMKTANRLNIRIIYEGLENIPKHEAFVGIVNEYSILDAPFLIYGIDLARQKTGAKLFRIRQYYGDNRNTYTLPLAQFGEYGNKLLPGAYETVAQHLGAGNPLVIVPTGKYDVRFFDNASRHIRFHSGFLRFASEAKVGILPIYMKLDFPFWMRLLNSLLPRFCQSLFHLMGPNILKNQTIRVTFGKLIPYSDVRKIDGRYPQSVLDEYEEKVRKLETDALQHRFYVGFL